MPVSPARQAAYDILCAVETRRKFAVDLLQGPRLSGLKEADRKLTTELVMGVLRWQGDLDFQIEQLSGRPLKYFDPEVKDILRLGIYQIRFLSAIPKSAAVNESAELAKRARKGSAVGLVNAVLRKCEKSARGFAEDGAPPQEYVESARRSIPGWMLARWERRYGTEAARAIMLASQSIPEACLRVQAGPCGVEPMRRELEAEGIRTRPGSFGRSTLRVESGYVQSSRAWREGRVMIQDEASQLIPELLSLELGQTVLDLCAAPGVKTGQIAESLTSGTIVACDRSLRRMRSMDRIREMPKGVRLHRVLLDAAYTLPFTRSFDRILIDAPCSGTGTLARNPEIKRRLQPGDLSRYAKRQAELLEHGLDVLAPGGRLVYSTCSLEPEENEEVVKNALGENPGYELLGASALRREFREIASLIEGSGFFRTLPGVHPMDGFFAAVIVREGRCS